MPDSIRSFGEPMAPAVTITSLSAVDALHGTALDDLDAHRAALLNDDAGDEGIVS